MFDSLNFYEIRKESNEDSICLVKNEDNAKEYMNILQDFINEPLYIKPVDIQARATIDIEEY